MTRTILIALLLACPTISFLTMFILRAQALSFKGAVPALRTRDDMARFKRLASTQMYASLAGIAMLIAPLVVLVVAMIAGAPLGWSDAILYVLLPCVAFFILGALIGQPLKDVKQIPVEPELAAERDHVVDVWLHKMLPDW